jgi:hypothetical protein
LERIALWVLALAGVAAVPTYLTGRPASALLSKVMPGLSMDAGDQHAEVAALALTLSLVCAAVAATGLAAFRRGKRRPSWFIAFVLSLAVLSTGTMIWTASLGGKVRHTEIAELRSLNRPVLSRRILILTRAGSTLSRLSVNLAAMSKRYQVDLSRCQIEPIDHSVIAYAQPILVGTSHAEMRKSFKP